MIQDKLYEIDYKGRTFFGSCEIDWGYEPAQRGGMTDPSWDAYHYVDGVDIETINWYDVNSEVYYFKIVRGDRNWLRINKLLVEVEQALAEKFSDMQPDEIEDDYSPDERKPDEYDLRKAQFEADAETYDRVYGK